MNLIVDGNNMAHRARYSYQLSYKGLDTSVVYGVLRMLTKLAQQQQPETILVCFDGGGVSAQRKRAVPDYKSKRHLEPDPTYPEFLRQLKELTEVLPKLGVAVCRRRGLEADDLLYHAAKLLPNAAVVSNDEDLLQVLPFAKVIKSSKQGDQLLTTCPYGVKPALWMLAKALLGDSSDNIQGCFGVGPKAVEKLLHGVKAEPSTDELVALAQARLGDKLAESVATFASTKLPNVVACIDLRYDRVGAKSALYHNLTWGPFLKNYAWRYFTDWGFLSLMETHFTAAFGQLRKPDFAWGQAKIPLVWDYERMPL